MNESDVAISVARWGRPDSRFEMVLGPGQISHENFALAERAQSAIGHRKLHMHLLSCDYDSSQFVRGTLHRTGLVVAAGGSVLVGTWFWHIFFWRELGDGLTNISYGAIES